MKIINSSALVGLPREVLALVRDGVYSLYTLPAATGGGAAYVLVTNKGEFYFLAEDGSPRASGGERRLGDIEVDQLVNFSDASSSPGLQINLA